MDLEHRSSDAAWWPDILERRPKPPVAAEAEGPWSAVEPFAFADTTARSFVLAHLGQSVDGRIATRTGHSHYVTGRENIVHLHRLRALADAVVVGVGTVATDDPRLTVRLVEGPNPVRVVVDPAGRLGPDRTLFRSDGPETLHLVAETGGKERTGAALRLACDGSPASVLEVLAGRGLKRVFVEGGGRTVSAFLAAGMIDRLQLCVAPVIIGSGILALSLPEIDGLEGALRPPCRTHPMGSDMLFDFDLSALRRRT